jgi:hypothetical protein
MGDNEDLAKRLITGDRFIVFGCRSETAPVANEEISTIVRSGDLTRLEALVEKKEPALLQFRTTATGRCCTGRPRPASWIWRAGSSARGRGRRAR